MRYGIFGDIHGNLEAFEVVLRELNRQKVTQLICVGDIVGYGAEPNGCVEKIRSLSIPAVAGNHDWISVGKSDINYLNAQARQAILWTGRNLKSENKRYLDKLPLVIEKNDFQLVHGSLKEPAEWHYILNLKEANDAFSLMKKSLLFIGHSHRPIIFSKDKEKIAYSFTGRLSIKEGVKYIINVGSVGQPRDGDPRAGYILFDDEKKEIVYKRIAYPVEKTQAKIKAAGLPGIEAARLADGR
ncbi:MAG: metallophosphoesterase family protein [Candidatus Ratteibacteria bacterium]|nr:metallophosphoesterase family protein [Candidatus Ratteibacteria bacterium]